MLDRKQVCIKRLILSMYNYEDVLFYYTIAVSIRDSL